MAAPINGWGMVGAWPAARIFSVHVLGVTYFPRGIYECLRYAPRHNIKVINLSLGAPGILPGDDPQLINAIATAKLAGINVVAAAGNDGGALDAPANHPGVLGVGGVDRAGFLCRYGAGGSASGRELDINASGCDLNLAFPTDGRAARGGATSEATAFTSAALAALRSYRPDLTPDAAEQILLDSATPIPAGRLLNVGGAFVAAGLAGVWNQAAAHVGPAPGSVQTQGPAPTSSQPLAPSGPAASPRPAAPQEVKRPAIKAYSSLMRPRFGLTRLGKSYRLRISNRPRGATVIVRVTSSKRSTQIVRRKSALITFNAPQNSRISVQFQLGLRHSRSTIVKRK